MRATIKDIAKKANVSINTVSRALNGKDDVKVQTRERILNIAKKINYTPNYLAKSLVIKQTKTLGVIVTDNANPFYATMIKGIEDFACQRGYNIILCNTDEDTNRELKALQLLSEKRVDGILITPTRSTKKSILDFKRLNIPFILLNRFSDIDDIDYVKTDHVYGAQLAVNRLLEIGRKRIAYIGGPAKISSVAERLEGSRKAMKQKGLSPRKLIIEHANLKMEDGYSAMKNLLNSEITPDGVFVYSDLMAIGAMNAIKEAGLKIPDDIAVVGYDDIEFASYLEIPLTTIRQARYEIGNKSAAIIIDKLENKKEKHLTRHIVLTPELIIRKSA